MFQLKNLKQLFKGALQDYAPRLCPYMQINIFGQQMFYVLLYLFSLFWCKMYWDFKRKIILIWDFQSRSQLFFFFFVKQFFNSTYVDLSKVSFKEQFFENIFENGKASFQDCYSKNELQKADMSFWLSVWFWKRKWVCYYSAPKKNWIETFWSVLPIKKIFMTVCVVNNTGEDIYL